MGWASKEESNDWIHPGDWHNDASHKVDLQDGVSSYMKDIEVVMLGGMGGGEEEAPPGGSAVRGEASAISVLLLSVISMLLMLSVLL